MVQPYRLWRALESVGSRFQLAAVLPFLVEVAFAQTVLTASAICQLTMGLNRQLAAAIGRAQHPIADHQR
jgi:hypothetical protein